MPEIVTTVGRFVLTDFEKEYAREIQAIVGAIPESKGLVKRIAEATNIDYDRIEWLIPQSDVLKAHLGVEIQKSLDDAEGIIRDALSGDSKVTDRQIKAAQWYLKEMGRSRGYASAAGSRQIGGIQAENLQINFVDKSDPDQALLTDAPKPRGRQKRTGTGPAPILDISGEPPGKLL